MQYNNYNKNQPRYYCKACQRHWTEGGVLRKVETGAGRRQRTKKPAATNAAAANAVRKNVRPNRSVLTADRNGVSTADMLLTTTRDQHGNIADDLHSADAAHDGDRSPDAAPRVTRPRSERRPPPRRSMSVPDASIAFGPSMLANSSSHGTSGAATTGDKVRSAHHAYMKAAHNLPSRYAWLACCRTACSTW